MATLSRTYTINLRHALRHCPDHRKTKKAVLEVKRFALKHMKAKEVRLGDSLNKHLWSQGIQNPPRRFIVAMHKDDTIVYVDLEGHDPVAIKGLTKEAKEKAGASAKKAAKAKTKETDAKEPVQTELAADVPADSEGKPAKKAPKKAVAETIDSA